MKQIIYGYTDGLRKTQLNRIAAHYKIEFEKRPLPKDEDVQTLVAQRLIGQLEARLRARDRLQIDVSYVLRLQFPMPAPDLPEFHG